jgi:SAM-dependent methyltransferase
MTSPAEMGWAIALSFGIAACQPRAEDGPRDAPSRGVKQRVLDVLQIDSDDAAQAPASDRTYMGRTLAPTMSHEAAPWLIRSEREKEELTSRMITELRLEPGDVACDVGAGNGYHTLMMAKLVAPGGRAVAVDIQPEMLEMLEDRAEEAGIENVETVLGEEADPQIPAGTCDVILMVDVYHELSDPEAMLGHLGRALDEGGEIALVEFREEDPAVPIKPLHKMSKAQIRKEYEANGFELVRQFDGLPWQHLMFFAKPR